MSAAPRSTSVPATVTWVSDGDTIKVRLGSGVERSVRLIGIDTPEVYYAPECGGAAASRRMRRLAPLGSTVQLTVDLGQDEHDRYGRLLRYVSRDGRDLGRTMVSAGLAEVYVFGGDPFARVSAYQRAESGARAAARGLWATCWR